MAELKKIQEYYNKTMGERQKELLEYYKGNRDVIPVYQRTAASSLKEASHTNMHINFFEDIISRKVGYVGQDIQFSFPEELEENQNVLFQSMLRNTKQEVVNSASMSLTSIQGISHRLIYTKDGEFMVKNIEGEKVVYNYDNDIYDPNEAYYYYRVTELDGEYQDRCDVYDKADVTYYIKSGGEYGIDTSKPKQPHNFNQVPLIPFINNSEWKSDCQDTTPLMDQYDEIISDTTGELKAARLAYLKIWGDLYTGQDADGNPLPVPTYLREFGTMLFGTDDEGKNLGDAQFLEKKLDDTSINNMLDRLRQHIYEQSGSVDLKEISDSSNARIVQIEASLSRLKQNAETTENYFRMALQKQFKLWAYLMQEMFNVTIPVEEMQINFVKSFTEDKKEKAEILAILLLSMSPVDAFREAGYKNAAELAKRYEENQSFEVV